MKEEFKKMWNNYKSRVHYIFNYKNNKEYDEIKEAECKEKDEEIERLKETIKNRKYIAIEKDNFIALLEKRILVLSSELSNSKKRTNELRNLVGTLSKQNDKLKEEVEKKELLRRQKAGCVGGLKATITKLEKGYSRLERDNSELKEKLEKAEHIIKFYRSNAKKPTLEEIKTYELSRRAVEKMNKTRNDK